MGISYKIRLALGCAWCLGLVSCLQGDETKKTGMIPMVRLYCARTICDDQFAGATAYVGLSNLKVHCDQFFASFKSTDSLLNRFKALGETKMRIQGQYLTGSVATWLSEGNGYISDLPMTNHTACAFIDLSSNGRWDTNEPVAQGVVAPDGDVVEIADWY